MYYGMLLMAHVLSAPHTQISLLSESQHLTSYGVYSAGKLTAAVVVNLDLYNATAGTENGVKGARGSKVVSLAGVPDGATVRRLSAPGAESKTGVTLAGVTVGTDGKLGGKEVLETVSGGIVTVRSSEAVLVTV